MDATKSIASQRESAKEAIKNDLFDQLFMRGRKQEERLKKQLCGVEGVPSHGISLIIVIPYNQSLLFKTPNVNLGFGFCTTNHHLLHASAQMKAWTTRGSKELFASSHTCSSQNLFSSSENFDRA